MMSGGLSLSRFTESIQRDAKYVQEESWKGTVSPEETKALLIESIKVRVFGSIFGAVALGLLGAGVLAAVSLNPVSALILTVGALFLFVIAHDLIVTGLNGSDFAASFIGLQKPDGFEGFFKNAWALGKAAYHDATQVKPYMLRDTWVLGKILPN